MLLGQARLVSRQSGLMPSAGGVRKATPDKRYDVLEILARCWPCQVVAPRSCPAMGSQPTVGLAWHRWLRGQAWWLAPQTILLEPV